MTATCEEPIDQVVLLRDGWAVAFNGRVCSPRWLDKGGGLAYLDALQKGTRKPEYHQP